MKRYISRAILGMAVAAGIQGAANADDLKPLTVGFSLDTKESSLETAWVDFLKSEGESQGKAAGLKFEWIINVANAARAQWNELLGRVEVEIADGQEDLRVLFYSSVSAA